MPRQETVFSELQVASGITDLDKVIGVTPEHLHAYHAEKVKRLQDSKKAASICCLQEAGKMVGNYIKTLTSSAFDVHWTGNHQEIALCRVPQDLFIPQLNLRISVKENSYVIVNHSPTQVHRILQGMIASDETGPDWYAALAFAEQEQYFQAIGHPKRSGCQTVEEFYQKYKQKERKQFAEQMKQEGAEDMVAYQILTKAVSERTVELFTPAIQKKNYEYYLCHFFRLNALPYLVAGTDHNGPFACIMPTIKQLRDNYEVFNVAVEATTSKQAQIMMKFNFQNKHTKEHYQFNQRVELRWGHGRFYGNQEAKIYADKWTWSDLPWVTKL